MPEIDLGLVRGKQGNPGTNGSDATVNGFTAINIIAGKNVNIDQSVPGTLEIGVSGVATLGDDGKLAENQRPDATGVGAADRTLSNLTDPQMALYNLGACVRPNLLDNWYFVGGGTEGKFPINQKGVTSTGDVEKNTICIDRWKRGEIDGIFTLDAAGLVSDGLNRTHIYQLLEPDYLYGKTVTLSAWTNLGVVFGTTTIPTVQEWPTDERKVITVYEDDSVCLKVILLPEPKRVQIQPETKTVLTLKSVKLEIGKTQTLAYKGPAGFWNLLDIPDYTTELLKCQRYMVNVSYTNYRASFVTGNSAEFFVPTPITMRTDPVLSGTAEVRTLNSTKQTGFSFALKAYENGIKITATKASHGLSDCSLAFLGDTFLNANL